jgi:large subunit ribosomal protein L15
MGTELHDLQPPAGARKKKKRVGRGLGSGNGKTAGRGSKGQLARRKATRPGFEGGQNPIHRRVPKRGFINIHREDVHPLNIGMLEGKFKAGATVDPEALHEAGVLPKRAKIIKLLGTGEIKTALKISVHKVSESARSKIEAAGGSVTLLETPAEAEASAG